MKWKPDPFLVGLVCAVILATLWPCKGWSADLFHNLSIAVIALMFFLQGARLSRQAMIEGMAHWRLHCFILACTFVVFPVIGLLFQGLAPHLLAPDIWIGILFLCCLPSTVQSSIAFTSIARGNISAAVCSATLSNMAGIFITPFLTGLVLSRHGAVSLHEAVNIVFQLLVPFLLGQFLQPYIGEWARRNKKLLSLTDRSSILLVVYTAFSHAVIEGLWHILSYKAFGLIAVIDTVLLCLVLLFTTYGSRLMGFARKDEIAIVFCGSKKSLASGVPMANVLFPAATVGMVVLPLMIFHQIQLFVCTLIAQHYARAKDGDKEDIETQRKKTG